MDNFNVGNNFNNHNNNVGNVKKGNDNYTPSYLAKQQSEGDTVSLSNKSHKKGTPKKLGTLLAVLGLASMLSGCAMPKVPIDKQISKFFANLKPYTITYNNDSQAVVKYAAPPIQETVIEQDTPEETLSPYAVMKYAPPPIPEKPSTPEPSVTPEPPMPKYAAPPIETVTEYDIPEPVMLKYAPPPITPTPEPPTPPTPEPVMVKYAPPPIPETPEPPTPPTPEPVMVKYAPPPIPETPEPPTPPTPEPVMVKYAPPPIPETPEPPTPPISEEVDNQGEDSN